MCSRTVLACSREIPSSNESYDEFLAARLWEESVKLVALERRLGTSADGGSLTAVGKALPERVTPPSVRGKPRSSALYCTCRSVSMCSPLMAGILLGVGVALVAVIMGLLVFRRF